MKGIKIFKGKPEQKIPYHNIIPFKRLLFVNNKILPKVNVHLAVTLIEDVEKISKKRLNYARLHSHSVDELNIILGKQKPLVYEIYQKSRKYRVISPSVVYIPKGIPHAARPLRGEGVFVCILLKGSLP